MEARIDALLRRVSASSKCSDASTDEETISRPPLLIQVDSHRVFVGETEVQLTAREFDVLVFLATHPGRAISRQEILASVWQSQFAGYEQSVATIVKRLRKKLEDASSDISFIETVRGVGYKFVDPAKDK